MLLSLQTGAVHPHARAQRKNPHGPLLEAVVARPWASGQVCTVFNELRQHFPPTIQAFHHGCPLGSQHQS